ncbi:MAG TPA: NUDIX hydrolase [Xanthobacteraceae bacterium]|jgi:8-oxo-dGTP pyrophosphatase MutT (NUDIX family)|nr:NUDIX hydrolase [Xanthobacteraceae bacterium]
MSGLDVIPIDHLDLAFVPKPWAFAAERRAEIDAHFAARRRAIPQLWNGRVLLLHEAEVTGTTLRGAFFETDFASFVAWRDWGFPPAAAVNCFAMGALRTSDGAFLAGVMGPHTANAGRVYFPAGTPDPGDVADGRVDLAGSVIRELAEETGLGPDDVHREPGWHAVLTGPRIALIKTLHVEETAEALRARVVRFLAQEAEPELADMRILRGPGDLDPMMPDFVPAFLHRMWDERR